MYPHKLFSQSDRHPKIVKNGKEVDIFSKVMHLAPARSSGFNVCPMASKGCEAACLNWAGFQYSRKQIARVERTKFFFEYRKEFMARLVDEIDSAERAAKRRGMICGIRLNGTSDIKWETIRNTDKQNVMQLFPDVCFMDYTKIANRKDLPPNYRLTFSRAESNEADCHKALANGMNVAVVFGIPLPKRFMGLRVIDGDVHDWRYGDYDEYPGERVIVGLTPKGHLAREDKTGFIFRN